MSAPRLRRPTSRGVVSPMHLVAVVIALVGGVAIVGIATLSPYSPFNMGSSQSSLSLAECSQIESSTNLTAGIVHLYYGDGNRTGPGSGLINQSLPGPSAYPPEDVAVANVEGGWNSVCTSHAFYVLEQRWGPQNAS
ncbi:MAG TPA: hypothetical protein VLX64_00960, partial [Thermoplasmata archaeon]|nr:hypothetical protein [Thermoplasmata archaeon]